MFGSLREEVCGAAARLADVIGAVPFDTAERALDDWTAVANAANAAQALLVARVLERTDDPTVLARVARTTGETSAATKERARVGGALRGHTGTRAVAGELSPPTLRAITDAVAVNPSAEARLLTLARSATLAEVRDDCARVKAAGDAEPAATEARIHARRRAHRWRDHEGAEHLHLVGTKVDMAKLDQATAPYLEQIFGERRADGVHEPLDAYAFDAYVRLAERGGAEICDGQGRPKVRYLTLLRVDSEALQRGRIEGDEQCEIAGLGPVPVATARELLGESVLKLVVTKGVDVINVTHLGRGVSAAQQIALLWQQPVCSREGCGRRARLENDHRDDWARVHCTELRNIDRLCHPDHVLKTRAGWALVAGTGRRPMVPPNHPDHPRNQRRRSPP